MAPRSLWKLIIAVLLLISVGAGTASANHDSDILDWVDSVTGTNSGSAYGITDVYQLFSGDKDDTSDTRWDKFDEKDDSGDSVATTKDLFKIMDVASGDYIHEVGVWNWNHLNNFDNGGFYTAKFPYITRSKLEHSDDKRGLIKDASVTIFSVDPHTYVHFEPRTQSVDIQEYQTGMTVSVTAATSARGNVPPGPKKTLKKTVRKIDTYRVDETRLYTTSCEDGSDKCLLASSTNNWRHIKFRDVELEKPGVQELIIEVDYYVKIISKDFVREEKYCRGTPTVIPDDTDGPRIRGPDYNNPDSDNQRRFCGYTEWEFVEGSKETWEADVTTDNTHTIVAKEPPKATAIVGLYPNGVRDYHVKTTPQTWTMMTAGKSESVVYSVWEFFSSRNKEWDLYCEKDGKRLEGKSIGDKCGGYTGDRNHADSSARPLNQHAFPSYKNYADGGYPHADILFTKPSGETYEYPNIAENSCAKNVECHWNIESLRIEDGETKPTHYEEHNEFMIRVFENKDLYIHGFMQNNYQKVEVTETREIHLAKLDMTIEERIKGEYVDKFGLMKEYRTPFGTSEDEYLVVKIQLVDLFEDAPINLKDRPGEYIKLTAPDGGVERIEPGKSGVVYVLIPERKDDYTVDIVLKEWWKLPSGTTPYVTASPTQKFSGDTFTTKGVVNMLFYVAIIILLPYFALNFFSKRFFGVDMKPDWWPF